MRLGEETLTALGYRVQGSMNPAAALEKVALGPATFSPSSLTDQTMPGMTGLLLASEIKEIRPGLPVLLMTGYSAALTPERVEAAGIRQVLLKPTNMRSLASAIHAALHGKPPR